MSSKRQMNLLSIPWTERGALRVWAACKVYLVVCVRQTSRRDSGGVERRRKTRWADDGIDGLLHLGDSRIERVIKPVAQQETELAARIRLAVHRVREIDAESFFSEKRNCTKRRPMMADSHDAPARSGQKGKDYEPQYDSDHEVVECLPHDA